MVLNTILQLAFLVVCVGSAGKIPSYVHICKRSDPQVAQCVKSSIEGLRHQLMKGIPELDVPRIEPFRVKNIVVSRGESPSSFKLILKNIDVYGVSEFQINKIKLDVPNLTFRIGVTIPALKMLGDYDVNARILTVPIKGTGKFSANATDCSGNGILRGKLEEIDGTRYLRFTELNLDLNIGDYRIHLNGGDPVIDQAANEILNANRKNFIEIARPYIQEKVSEMLLVVANKIVKNFKYDEVFPA